MLFSYKSFSDMPYMCYGLAHEFGAVWDMAWCPSGAYEPNKKIGLLALSTSCGDCPVFAMPHVEGNLKKYYLNWKIKWKEINYTKLIYYLGFIFTKLNLL